MERNLRTLAPNPPARIRAPYRTARVIFACVVIALLYHLFMGSNVIRVLTGGEAPNLRFSPAGILMLLAVLYALIKGPLSFHALCRQWPGLVIYFCAIPVFMIYTVLFNGFSGAAFYFDSFWAPAFMAIAMKYLSPRQQRVIARLLLSIVVLNIVFGLVESATRDNIFPFVNDSALDAREIERTLASVEDFRANAFYSHPLTASLVTAMGLFMAFAMRLSARTMAAVFVLIFLGLLAFGGRTALVIAGAGACLTGISIVLGGLLRRTLKPGTIGYIMLAVLVMPLLLGYVITQTSIAERIVDTFYMDDSAEVRVIQWQVLGYLDLKNWLFGVPMQELLALKYQVGLYDAIDIENCWLLIFLNQGAIGFIAFLVVLGVFLVHIARYPGGLYAWGLMLTGLIIDSGSNSLGVRSSDLVVETAMLMALAGFRHYQPAVRMRLAVPRQSVLLRPDSSRLLAPRPVPALRGLSVRPLLRAELR